MRKSSRKLPISYQATNDPVNMIDLTAFDLSSQELSDLLEEATPTAAQSGTRANLEYDLADAGVDGLTGTFTVEYDGRALDADDFMI